MPSALPRFDDLGVAGHDFDAGFFSGSGHTLHDAFEVTQGEAFFQNKAAGNVERRSTANGYVVNRTVNGEASDIASRKENRLTTCESVAITSSPLG